MSDSARILQEAGEVYWQYLLQEPLEGMGTAFDVRRFNDALVGSGSMPLPILERHIDWFIENERQRLA